MKDKIILICGDIGIGSTIVNKLNSIGFNDVVIAHEAEHLEPERGITMNIHAPIINDYMPSVYEHPIDYKKQNRKGGKKNKKNWRY